MIILALSVSTIKQFMLDYFSLLLDTSRVGLGRQPKKENDLFYLCSLIDYTARKTTNQRKTVVNAIGKERLAKIYDLADVYHCENIDKISDELIEEFHIQSGDFDNVKACKYSVPSHWDIGKVYQRLITRVAKEEKRAVVDILIEVYNSWISDAIDNYNTATYYSDSRWLFLSYMEGEPLKE